MNASGSDGGRSPSARKAAERSSDQAAACPPDGAVVEFDQMNGSRFFNNSGPVNESDHWCVPPIKRLDTKRIWQLIQQKKYFSLLGPKQSGKTSYLLALARLINHNGAAKCLYINVETLRGIEGDMEESMRSLLYEISSRARDNFDDDWLEDMVSGILEKRGPYHALNELLTQWSKKSSKPIVLLIDEIDTLSGQVLTSVLSQIRAGYDKRPALFPQSIIFCGTHDVIEKQFNIKDATIRLERLTREEVDGLMKGYASGHGMGMEDEALQRVWYWSSGQPWIVSALAAELLQEMAPAKGIGAITAAQVDEAVENLIARKGNHLDFLASRLRDERVKKCMVPLLMGEALSEGLTEDELHFVRELGIVTLEGTLELSNNLYREMVPRALFGPVCYMINMNGQDFRTAGGTLDTLRLMKAFQAFFRHHIERLSSFIDYGAAAHVLVFQALLQKLAGPDIIIQRDYGLDAGRVVITLQQTYPVRRSYAFYILHFQAYSADQYRGMAPKQAEEAASWLESSDAQVDELVVAALNMNPRFDWEGKSMHSKREKGDRVIHVWAM